MLHIVDDDVPEISINILTEACSRRGLPYQIYNASTFIFAPENIAAPGDSLFRPAISANAIKVEQHLYQPGVSTFYSEPDGVYFNCNNASKRFESLDIPVPRSFYLTTTDRSALDYYVSQLGGYPVVLKALGHSRGMGVMKLESQESLYSVVDYVSINTTLPLLCAFIPDAVHWRCLVIGDRVIASYINPTDTGDFRTYGTSDPKEVFQSAEDELADIAVASVHALGYRFGGVDILRHPSGRCYVLEANFPCYYAHAQEVAGIAVADAMLDYLIAN